MFHSSQSALLIIFWNRVGYDQEVQKYYKKIDRKKIDVRGETERQQNQEIQKYYKILDWKFSTLKT